MLVTCYLLINHCSPLLSPKEIGFHYIYDPMIGNDNSSNYAACNAVNFGTQDYLGQ